ncbi:hypothetical protein L3Q82_013140, partial [Scortum barcoo]
YESLRIGGLVFAVVLFVMGIALIVSPGGQMQNQVFQELRHRGKEQWRSDSLFTESEFPDRSDFDYDYETLRTTGVILAVIMFVSGILIALSKKFTKCVKSSSK